MPLPSKKPLSLTEEIEEGAASLKITWFKIQGVIEELKYASVNHPDEDVRKLTDWMSYQFTLFGKEVKETVERKEKVLKRWKLGGDLCLGPIPRLFTMTKEYNGITALQANKTINSIMGQYRLLFYNKDFTYPFGDMQAWRQQEIFRGEGATIVDSSQAL